MTILVVVLQILRKSDFGFINIKTSHFTLSWSKTLTERPKVAVSSDRYLGPIVAPLIRDTSRFYITEPLDELENTIRFLQANG